MKLKNLFIALLFVGTLFSCSSDDATTDNTSLVGTWDFVGVEVEFSAVYEGNAVIVHGIGDNYAGTVVLTSDTYTADVSCDVIATANGILIQNDLFNHISGQDQGTWSVDGNVLSIISDELGAVTSTAIFSNSGDTVTLEGTIEIDVESQPTEIEYTVVLNRAL